MSWGALGLFGMVFGLARLVLLVLWIFLMVKASQGVRFRIPVVADIADNIAGKQI
jgi:uncharacterized membrane protein